MNLFYFYDSFLIIIIIIICFSETNSKSKDFYQYPDEEKTETVAVFTSLIEPPFLSRIFDHYSQKEVLIGFIPDLVAQIASRLKMPYRLKLVSEGGYGILNDDGLWNGLIGEIINGDADIAAAPLTVNLDRRKFIDFTRPFMTTGIATVIKKPSDIKNPPIISPYELAYQKNIDYGLIPGTLTWNFFQNSNNTAITKMWNFMYYYKPEVFEWSSNLGIDRVRKSDGYYAFFVESAFAEYLINKKPCDLMLLKELLNVKKYSFAVKKNSKFLKKLNKAIRFLEQNKIIEHLRNKWWKNECENSNNFFDYKSIHFYKTKNSDIFQSDDSGVEGSKLNSSSNSYSHQYISPKASSNNHKSKITFILNSILFILLILFS